MKRPWVFRDGLHSDQYSWARSRRSLYVAAVLLLLVLPVAGCSFETAAPETADMVQYALQPTTTTEVSPTEAEATTTTEAETTTTTEAETTTTTLPEETAPPVEPDPVLYELTDWSTGLNGWAAAGQWKTIAGMLVTDGTSDSFAVAPVNLGDVRNYAVECEIQIIDPGAGTNVYIMARMINGLGYWAGFNGDNERLVIGYGERDVADAHFTLDGAWHKYRFELYDNTMKLFFEGAELARAMDNHSFEAGTVGIYCGNGQINVRAFRVIELPAAEEEPAASEREREPGGR